MLESLDNRQMKNEVTYTEQNPPEEGAAIFLSNPLYTQLYTSWTWLDSDEHRHWLQRGLVHPTPALAVEKARQMLVLGSEHILDFLKGTRELIAKTRQKAGSKSAENASLAIERLNVWIAAVEGMGE